MRATSCLNFASLALAVAAAQIAAAEEIGAPSSPYMGAPVELVNAPNGAVANKKLLDRVGDFNWLEPTIERLGRGQPPPSR